jgi:deazaflavin-dependent oxidoreductase (nitroreductase family)
MALGASSVEQYLYLTTRGRRTGLPRTIEIWFVQSEGNYYILAEHFLETQWVRNIMSDGRVTVRVGGRTFTAVARVLDRVADAEAWETAARLAREKYDWGDGLPVEIVPDKNSE